jgi:hypothetical protein
MRTKEKRPDYSRHQALKHNHYRVAEHTNHNPTSTRLYLDWEMLRFLDKRVILQLKPIQSEIPMKAVLVCNNFEIA